MMEQDLNHVHWFGLWWIPGKFGFCPSEAAWDAALKELGEEHTLYPAGCRGRCTTFLKTRRRNWHSIVTVDDAAHDGTEPGGVIFTLAHEATHVWQDLMAAIGQDVAAGAEIEAYGIGYIAGCLKDAYDATRPAASADPEVPTEA